MQRNQNDLETYFNDEQKEWKKDCYKYCNKIEYLAASYLGRRQFKLVRELMDKKIPEHRYKETITNITSAMKLLAETSSIQREKFSGDGGYSWSN